MNEDSKYYTPEIEEFYTGFEFEYYYKSDWHKHDLDGSPIVHHELDEFKDDLMKLAHAICRVKFLDREDIESCKWEFTGKGVVNWYKIKGDFKIGTWTAYEAIMIHDPSCNWVKIHVIDRGDEVDVFQGTIKNKSELKKILKMLGI